MPKHDFLLKPGEELPESIGPLIRSIFRLKERDKLTRHGGLIRISLAAPYSPSKGYGAKKAVLDEGILQEIEQLKGDPEKLEALLATFRTKALLELCKRIGMPVNKSQNARELKAQLLTTFRAGHIWNKIAGNISEPDGTEKPTL